MIKVFVSYTTRDHFISKDYLQLVNEAISKYAEPFIDILHNTDSEKQEFVKKELLSSNILLLLSSKSITSSPWVNWEIEQATNYSIPIITINVIEHELSSSLLEIETVLLSKLTIALNGTKTVDSVPLRSTF